MLDVNAAAKTFHADAKLKATEKQRNDALNREVHLVAQNTVLQTLLKAATDRIRELEASAKADDQIKDAPVSGEPDAVA